MQLFLHNKSSTRPNKHAQINTNYLNRLNFTYQETNTKTLGKLQSKRKPAGDSWVERKSINRHKGLVKSFSSEKSVYLHILNKDHLNTQNCYVFPTTDKIQMNFSERPDLMLIASAVREGEIQSWRERIWKFGAEFIYKIKKRKQWCYKS